MLPVLHRFRTTAFWDLAGIPAWETLARLLMGKISETAANRRAQQAAGAIGCPLPRPEALPRFSPRERHGASHRPWLYAVFA